MRKKEPSLQMIKDAGLKGTPKEEIICKTKPKRKDLVLQMIKDAGEEGITVNEICNTLGLSVSIVKNLLAGINEPITEVDEHGCFRGGQKVRLYYCSDEFYRRWNGKGHISKPRKTSVHPRLIQMLKDAGTEGIWVHELCKELKITDINASLNALDLVTIITVPVPAAERKKNGKKRMRKAFYCDSKFYDKCEEGKNGIW